ncbi:MAG TPA: cupin-like domain-containing protein [Bacteroidales bacterium]|nr:cupin-like domain-containing protein [Bacteroidales bacterium]
MNLSLPIESVDSRQMNRERFRKEYVSKAKPLILKGFADLFPAGKQWTFDYLDQKMGDHIVGIIDNSIKKNTAVTGPDLKMKFSEFSAIIRRDEETPYRIFLFNMFRECPEMRKDFPTPELVKGVLGNLGLTFFGGKNTTVRFHFDIDCSGVLMTQVIGRKRVILIPPSYDKLLYKIPFASFSLIDLEKRDYEKFPGLRYVEGHDFILQPGDALFMPSRFWHFNTYLEGGMAISYRILASRPLDIYNGIMNTTLRLLFDKSMNGMLGEKWMERKKTITFRNAVNAMKNLQPVTGKVTMTG